MYRLGLTLILGTLLALPAVASNRDFTNVDYVPGRLVVDFTEEVGTLYEQNTKHGEPVQIGVKSVDDLLAQYEIQYMWRLAKDETLARLKNPPDWYRHVVLQGPEDIDVPQMYRDFAANPYVSAVDLDILYPVLDTEPDDPNWGSQWDKRCMGLPRAWDFSTGSEELQVIAIDGGTCWQHPDFRDNLWVNPGEDLDGDRDPWTWDDYPGDTDDLNGVDDESNGMEDDFIGWDFIRNISGCVPGEDCDNFEDNDPISVGDHGTHVLGLMGEQGNNDLGATGCNWDVSIMASRAGYTRASDDQGLVVSTAAVSCIMWALGHGVDVINMSYGSNSGHTPTGTAISTAWDQGAIIFGASGNDGVDDLHFPAAFDDAIAVGSTDNQDDCLVLSDFSNYGTWVECYAPGANVFSTLCPNQVPSYGNNLGTSMASPNAAGVAALLWSIFPNATNAEVRDMLLQGCESMIDANPDEDPADLGWGRVDIENSLAQVLPYLSVVEAWIENDDDNDGRLEAGETGDLYLSIHNEIGWQNASNVTVNVTTADDLQLVGATFNIGNVPTGQTVDNASLPVQITAGTDDTYMPYWATLVVTMTDDNNAPVTHEVPLRIGRGDILLVDDDEGAIFSNFFATVMDSYELPGGGIVSFKYDTQDRALDDEFTYEMIQEYHQVVWVCGNETSNTLTEGDMTALMTFMDNGGDLLLAGQGVDDDATVTGNSFFSDYLHASPTGTEGSVQLAGVAGDLISDDIRLVLVGGACGGNGSVSPSVVEPINGGIGFFGYGAEGNDGNAAVRFHSEPETYRTAYFSFAIEAACGQIPGTQHHRDVIYNTLIYLGGTTQSAEQVSSVIPKQFALQANYPNPFNPETTIRFDIGSRSVVKLRVFDLLGREVSQLVDQTMSPGSYEVRFDGSNLASGVYLVNLVADDFSQTRRMVLMK